MNIVDKARTFALAAHAAINQRRKYTGEPYITHPAAVVNTLYFSEIYDEATIAAAWLHDVVEDTKVSDGTILAAFGLDVWATVCDLTDTETGNRETRKRLARERLAAADKRVQDIKVADLIDNAASIIKHDPAFAKVYMREKHDLLAVLTKADPGLRAVAQKIVDDYFADKETVKKAA
ncbi:MAG TPA: HD domain-containing protein [Xanthobacteraceae bacterium]|nr:HD domain-containing protein [Xanthobacteraceae bacterium]